MEEQVSSQDISSAPSRSGLSAVEEGIFGGAGQEEPGRALFPLRREWYKAESTRYEQLSVGLYSVVVDRYIVGVGSGQFPAPL